MKAKKRKKRRRRRRRRRREKKENSPIKEWEKAKRKERKFPIKEWEKVKKEEEEGKKAPDQGSKEKQKKCAERSLDRTISEQYRIVTK